MTNLENELKNLQISDLKRRQIRFIWMVSKLIEFAYNKGYYLTGGDLWATTGHIKRSKHYERCAIDLNLFVEEDGRLRWLKNTEDHKELGEYWETVLGGRWGGRWNDGNHYELP